MTIARKGAARLATLTHDYNPVTQAASAKGVPVLLATLHLCNDGRGQRGS